MEKRVLSSYIEVLKSQGLSDGSNTENPSDFLRKKENRGISENTVKDTHISGLFYDSRRCEKNGIFFCKGRNFSEKYLAQALAKGCAGVIYGDRDAGAVEKISNDFDHTAFIKVGNVRKAMAVLSAFHYGYPLEKAIAVAVTGTKGKTGTVWAICNCINEKRGFKAMVLNSALPTDAPSLTTPESVDLHAAARKCIDSGATHIICEISSQGVKEDRIYGIDFDLACFLNFGSDHVSPDEHPTVDDYFNSKAELFNRCRSAIVSLDCDKSRDILSIAEKSPRINGSNGKKEIYTFSAHDKNADFYARITEKTDCASLVSIFQGNDGKNVSHRAPSPLFVPIPGDFNVENSLAAFSVCKALGCSENEIFRGVLMTRVDGRMEIFNTADGKVRVIVDYAHNKMSFEALFKAAINTYAPDRSPKITTVFGCSGGKAYTRRYDLPYVALKYSDRIIVCEDDSGKEGFENIRNEILKNASDILSNERWGCTKKAGISVIRDRTKAIRSAVINAMENSEERLILFLGRGRENRMITENGARPTVDDVSSTLTAIEEYDRRLSLEEVFTRSRCRCGQLITVCLNGEKSITENFAFSVFELLRYGISVAAVCDKECSEQLKEDCFKNGIVCRFESLNTQSPPGKTTLINEIKSTSRAGMLYTVIANGDVKDAAADIAVREKADALVYLTLEGGIIFNGKRISDTLSLKTAAALSEQINAPYLKIAVNALHAGVGSVAVIDGMTKGAIAFYGAKCGFTGTVIRRDATL